MLKVPTPDHLLMRRFWSKVLVGDGCWEWQARSSNGYGRFTINRRNHAAHRVSYEWMVGPIPDGWQIDHLCRNPACVRPDHLEPVTPRVNVLRSAAVTARNARKRQCRYGHPLKPGTRADGYRGCPVCQRRFDRESKRRARDQKSRLDGDAEGE